MPDDYDFINARLKVMRTKLLDGRALDSAAASGTYAEFLRVLSETPISGDLVGATAPDAGLPELDAALSRNLFETANKVLRMADGDARAEISVLLMKWDLVNLKTVARGIIAGRSQDDILGSLVPGGSLKPSTLQAAVQSGDLASAAQAIALSGHPLARAFKDAVAAYAAGSRSLDLEVTLDQGYYRHALRVSRNTSLRRYLSREVDVTNALTARSLRGGSLNPALFVPGGSDIDTQGFARLAGGDNAAGDMTAILEAPTLEGSELAARRVLDRAATDASAGDPLGVGVAIDFLRRKEQEIAKLRLIGRAKFYGVPTEQIRAELERA
ncbi:V0D/AC39 family V-type ATPase subunit [Deinococcus maricopensis]|uniref:V-type ATP synthase subunit C n=1 Tax=Deinococcus maricopensis (strain DSM 21211 / LMG 22137 / NRRL B-23946 / LB-34) TaxID=709986 RepID=E8UBE9_DEIML|nr:V-type ATPase subunit [Deinococcus maricopensis]ADV68388.1 V-type ATP synthase subunit C [Deinococcus maricopensis DSM 21211]